MAKKVTVVICAYSHVNFFAKAFHSVISQDYSDFEIIVHNNGADPIYRQLIEDTARTYGARVVSTYPNTYGLALREQIIPTLNSPYLAILHDDDEFCPQKLSKSVAQAEEGNYDYVITNYECIDENGHLVANEEVNDKLIRHDESVGELLADFFVPPGCRLHYSTLLIKTEFAREMLLGDPFFPRIADCLFWSQILLNENRRGAVLPNRLSRVRIHGANDRLYSKFSRRDRTIQFFLLGRAEEALFQYIIERAPALVLNNFLGKLINHRGILKTSRVEALVIFAVIMDGRQPSISKSSMVTISLHEAYRIDPYSTIKTLQIMAGSDATTFFNRAYTRTAQTYGALLIGTLPILLQKLCVLYLHPKFFCEYMLRLFSKSVIGPISPRLAGKIIEARLRRQKLIDTRIARTRLNWERMMLRKKFVRTDVQQNFYETSIQ